MAHIVHILALLMIFCMHVCLNFSVMIWVKWGQVRQIYSQSWRHYVLIECYTPSHHLSVHGDTVYNFIIISSLIQYEVTAGMLTESNGSLPPGGGWLLKSHLRADCLYTAGSAPGPALGNEYRKTLFFATHHSPSILAFRHLRPAYSFHTNISST